VGLALREPEQFGFQFRQEWGSPRKKHTTGVELPLLNVEPPDLIAIDRDRLDCTEQDVIQLLGERDAGGSVLNQDGVRFETLRERNGCISELRIFITVAREIEQIIMIVAHQPSGANGPVILGAIFGRGIPALNDLGPCGTLWKAIIIAQPGPLDHGTPGRHRGLLILSCEHVRPQRSLQRFESLNRLVGWVQRLADAAFIKSVGANLDALPNLSYCRQTKN